METKVVAAGAIGAGAGALQTPLIREFVDRKYPTTNIPALKGFGTPSALIGLISGGLGLSVGAIGMSKGKDGRPRLADVYVEPAIDYGIVALVGRHDDGDFILLGLFADQIFHGEIIKLVNHDVQALKETFYIAFGYAIFE